MSQLDKNDKKKRGSNFTSTEIELLMRCILHEIRIIENKQTDGATLKEKNDAWERVTNTFQSLTKDVYRNINSLKMKYDNIKKTLKKKITEAKQSYTKTGGGPPIEVKLVWFEEQLYSYLQLGIQGLPSVGDSDMDAAVVDVMPQLITAQDRSYTLIDFDQFEEPSDNFDSRMSNDVDKENNSNIERIVEANESSTLPMVEKSNIGQSGSSTKRLMASNNWNLRKRKNTVTFEQKKNTIDSYQKLAEEKCALTIIQKECYETELKKKKDESTFNEREWELKTQILEKDLEIKNQQLDDILEERERKRKIFIMTEEEQKLKIEILKCDLNNKLKQNLGLISI